MLNQLLKEIITLTIGKGNEQIAELLHSKKHINEFTIAKKMEITINQTRNLLYKISDYGLVSSERKKDKKKGWYTYYWKFNIMKCLEFLKKRLLESKERFQTQIERRENKQYYVCQYCNLEYSEDEAILMDFTCDECGELFTIKDNSNLIKGLKKNLEKIEQKLQEIEVEIEKEQKKINRKKMISIKAEQEEKEKKKEEAKKRREEKKKEREKLKEKTEKKAVKKKTIKKKTTSKKKVTKKKVSKKIKPKKTSKLKKPKQKKANKKSTSKKKIIKKKK